MEQPRFVDILDRLSSLSRRDGNLEAVNVGIDRETFRPAPGAAFGETPREADYLAPGGQIVPHHRPYSCESEDRHDERVLQPAPICPAGELRRSSGSSLMRGGICPKTIKPGKYKRIRSKEQFGTWNTGVGKRDRQAHNQWTVRTDFFEVSL